LSQWPYSHFGPERTPEPYDGIQLFTCPVFQKTENVFEFQALYIVRRLSTKVSAPF